MINRCKYLFICYAITSGIAKRTIICRIGIKDFQILSYLNIIDYLKVNYIQKKYSNIFKLQQQKIRKLKIGFNNQQLASQQKNRKDNTLKNNIYKNTDILMFQVGGTIGDYEFTCYYKVDRQMNREMISILILQIKFTYLLTLNNNRTRIKDIRADLIIFIYLQLNCKFHKETK
ncbi:unnamed protein product [Paramecium pentaurelia]|uniref:Uncharacterized protein n=1 Tax=Paramecium pentaurelia TaxID=43138 RepID=A0A8S1S865_9CILI|nr:unnamed protein product [Paramecium pentaurelia]